MAELLQKTRKRWRVWTALYQCYANAFALHGQSCTLLVLQDTRPNLPFPISELCFFTFTAPCPVLNIFGNFGKVTIVSRTISSLTTGVGDGRTAGHFGFRPSGPALEPSNRPKKALYFCPGGNKQILPIIVGVADDLRGMGLVSIAGESSETIEFSLTNLEEKTALELACGRCA